MKILLIDSSYLIYKSYFAYPSLTNNGEPVGALYGYCKTIMQLIENYRPDQVVIAGDTPKPTWRHIIATNYKAGRPKVEDNLAKQFPIINQWANKITSNYYSIEGYEADDVIFTIAMELLSNLSVISKRASSSTSNSIFEEGLTGVPSFPYKLAELTKKAVDIGNTIFVFSSDRDLYQMLNLPNLCFLQSSKLGLEEFHSKDFVNKYRLNALQWLDYKALVGDPGDNLKGVEGIGPKTATGFLQSVGSLYRFCELTNLDPQPFLRTSGASWVEGDSCEQYLNNPKNGSLIQKIKDNYEVVKYTYMMSSLQIVPEVKLKTTGYCLNNGIEDLQQHGLKSLITMTNKLSPNDEQEGLF